MITIIVIHISLIITTRGYPSSKYNSSMFNSADKINDTIGDQLIIESDRMSSTNSTMHVVFSVPSVTELIISIVAITTIKHTLPVRWNKLVKRA